MKTLVLMPKTGLGFALILFMAVAGAGCNLFKKPKVPQVGPPPPVETRHSLTLAVKADPNANGGNRVRVVLYQLQRKEAFMASSRQAFWTKKETLQPDLAGNEQGLVTFEIDPNGARTEKMSVFENARFVGVAVDFFKPNGNFWRATMPLPAGKSATFNVRVQNSSVTIQ